MSFIVHDFVHYCVETEAGITDGFFGLLEQGYTFAQLSGKEPLLEARRIPEGVERVTGALTSVVQGRAEPARVMVGMKNLFEAHQEELPPWLSEELIGRVSQRYQRIIGEWRTLRFGEVMQFRFGDRT